MMEDWSLTTPVVLLIYNRPEKTAAVFEQVSAVEPTDLLIVADGPTDEADAARCRETREVIDPDWECTVYRNYATENLGLEERIISGLDWVFDTVEEAIILEDDCFPSESFFRFCESMLSRYRHDERVMEISGTNHLGTWSNGPADYHFSLMGSIWGWATWSRAWDLYDADFELWADPVARQRFSEMLSDRAMATRYRYLYDGVDDGTVSSWAYRWQFSRIVNSGLSVIPSKNMIHNIGFDDAATNTTTTDGREGRTIHDLSFPLTHPRCIAPDRVFDRKAYEETQYGRLGPYVPDVFYERVRKLYRDVVQ